MFSPRASKTTGFSTSGTRCDGVFLTKQKQLLQNAIAQYTSSADALPSNGTCISFAMMLKTNYVEEYVWCEILNEDMITVPSGGREDALSWPRPVFSHSCVFSSISESDFLQRLAATTLLQLTHIVEQHGEMATSSPSHRVFRQFVCADADSKTAPLFDESDKARAIMPKVPRKPLRNRSSQPTAKSLPYRGKNDGYLPVRRLPPPLPSTALPSNGIKKKAPRRRSRNLEVNRNPKGLTMCLRKLVRCLLAGTHWIVDDKIGKDRASELVKILIGPKLESIVDLKCPCKPFEGSVDWKEQYYDDILARIINHHLGIEICGSEVEAYITRSSGKYFLSTHFKTFLGDKQWPPQLPHEQTWECFGCYVNPRIKNPRP